MSETIRLSVLFGRPLKAPPRDAQAVNHRLLVQAGFVDQLMAGVFTYLPLGLRVLRRIQQIVREEMNALGGQEVLMPALHPKEPWVVTGRWADPGPEVMFQFKGRGDKDLGLGWSHEEIVVPLARQWIQSYRDLPLAVYQIQDKFRNEPRAKSGLLRGREFNMKDLYSFHADQADFERFYRRAMDAYQTVFTRCGLETLLVEAGGGAFSPRSHEFQVFTPSGEDTILKCTACAFAQNREIAMVASGDPCPRCGGKTEEARGIEVGNIFPLHTRFSDAFDVTYVTADGEHKPVVMGCYGLGPSRVLGAIVETHHDDRGIVWPMSVAPAAVYVVPLEGRDGADVRASADTLLKSLASAHLDVIVDDREAFSPGEKFADADLIGVPWRVVVSASHARAGTVGLKHRTESAERAVHPGELLRLLGESAHNQEDLGGFLQRLVEPGEGR